MNWRGWRIVGWAAKVAIKAAVVYYSQHKDPRKRGVAGALDEIARVL